MIATLVNLDEEQTTLLLVVIQQDNLARMKRADPITLETQSLGGILPVAKYPEKLGLLIAYEEDDVELWKLAKGGDMRAMINYIRRGYKFNRDEDGTERAFKINEAVR